MIKFLLNSMSANGLTLLFAGLMLSGCYQSVEELPPALTKLDPELVQITGKLEYQDRFYNQNGFIANNLPYKPIRETVVDLVDESGEIQASTTTNQIGLFTFDNIPVGSYNLQVIARSKLIGGQTVSVFTHQNALYAISKPFEFTELETTANWRISFSSEYGYLSGIFNMLDVMGSAYEYVDDISSNSLLLQDLNLFWQRSNTTGTYTCFNSISSGCNNGSGIYVLGGSSQGDTDEYDDDVLWHEFGHWLEFSLDMIDSPGGAHSFSDRTLDLRLAWSEGQASYFQAAVKDWLKTRNSNLGRLSIPSNMAASFYVDTIGNGRLAIDYQNLSQYYVYSSNEAAVTKVLWLMKERSNLETALSPFISHLQVNATGDSLESYWDGLLEFRSESSPTASMWKADLAERQIIYEQDSYEPNNLINEATLFDCQTSTVGPPPITCIDGVQFSLYLEADLNSRDVDYFTLQLTGGVTYVISTLDMTNGADTQMSLFDAAGAPLLDGSGIAYYNDDKTDCGICSPNLHDGTHFSSELTVTPANDETIYLLVETADGVYDFIGQHGSGRYGSYRLSVSAS